MNGTENQAISIEYKCTIRRPVSTNHSSNTSCILCLREFNNQAEFVQHFKEHNESLPRANSNKQKQKFFLELVKGTPNDAIVVLNRKPLELKLIKMFLIHPFHLLTDLLTGGESVTLKSGEKIEIPLASYFLQAPNHPKYSLVLFFESSSAPEKEFLEQYDIAVECSKDVSPPTAKPGDTLLQAIENTSTVPLVSREIEFEPLPAFEPSPLVRTLVDFNFNADMVLERWPEMREEYEEFMVCVEKCDSKHHIRRLDWLVQIEDYSKQKDYLNYSLEWHGIEYRREKYELWIADSKPLPRQMCIGSVITLENSDGGKYQAEIRRISDHRLTLKFEEDKPDGCANDDFKVYLEGQIDSWMFQTVEYESGKYTMTKTTGNSKCRLDPRIRVGDTIILENMTTHQDQEDDAEHFYHRGRIEELKKNNRIIFRLNQGEMPLDFHEDYNVEIHGAVVLYEQQKLDYQKSSYTLEVDNLLDLPSGLSDGDVILLTPMQQRIRNAAEAPVFEGVVDEINRHVIIFQLREDVSELDVEVQYFIQFKPNRVPFRREREALQTAVKSIRFGILKCLFPWASMLRSKVAGTRLNLGAAQINPEQQTAVTNIVRGTSFPAPYIIFGPPGTGKTSTLVEAIIQLCIAYPDVIVLVSAQSNRACDEIAIRLIERCQKRRLEKLRPDQIYRFYAPSWDGKAHLVDNRLKTRSPFKTGTFAYPNWDTFHMFRVVIATLYTSGRLLHSNIRQDYFTHLFIDEASCASEAASLIPIAGLFKKNEDSVQVVLCGDHKQLGPVVVSRFANEKRFDTSMLERLMIWQLYKRDEKYKRHNPNLVTKLVRNYRSHPDILHVPNRMFYHGELVPLASPQTCHFALRWSQLSNPCFPILVHHVEGRTEKDEKTGSSFNEKEIALVLGYVKDILNRGIGHFKIVQRQIGVITPYRKQCFMLQELFSENNLVRVNVGTVEKFQGQESPIVIISTVKSNTGLGFLDNPKRFNVALTRAQGLLILVCNTKTLMTSKYWKEFLDFCQHKGGIRR